jgi:hypothetical protein
MLSNGICDSRCAFGLATIQNARLALGKNVVRVNGLLLTPEGYSKQRSEADVDSRLPTRVLWAPEKEFLRLESQIDPDRHTDAALSSWIFLVDPAGNLMLEFPPGSDFVGLVNDLKRLLAASSHG